MFHSRPHIGLNPQRFKDLSENLFTDENLKDERPFATHVRGIADTYQKRSIPLKTSSICVSCYILRKIPQREG